MSIIRATREVRVKPRPYTRDLLFFNSSTLGLLVTLRDSFGINDVLNCGSI